VNRGTIANKRMHFKSHKRNAFRLDVRENKAARALKEHREWAAPDLDDLAYKGFNGAAAVRTDRSIWECELDDAFRNGWEWGIYETAYDRYMT
jgi:hypothetical protein